MKNIKPTEKEMKIAIENGWEGVPVKTGYEKFKNNENSFIHIERIDDMGIFESDIDAFKEACEDGYVRPLELPKVLKRKNSKYIKDFKFDFDYDYLTAIDCEENKEILRKWLIKNNII